jgi:hypothetical protein
MASKLDSTLFNMKLTSKQMQRESHNCEKREKEHTKKALAAMQKNNVVRSTPGRAGGSCAAYGAALLAGGAWCMHGAAGIINGRPGNHMSFAYTAVHRGEHTSCCAPVTDPRPLAPTACRPSLPWLQEGARIHAGDAIREKNQALQFLSLSSRIDGVAAR